MARIYGWTRRVLFINATELTCSIMEPDDNILDMFIGGRGMAGYYLRPFAHLPFDSPDMPLIFMAGPLTGTPSPLSGRLCVMSKSPLTGIVSVVNAGGTFGTELKKAGWDGIILAGKSSSPLGIVIKNSSVEFQECEFAPTMTLSQRAERFDTGAFAVTGPAAENGVLFSSIHFSGDISPGRGGTGLVMACKNIRFIHVTGSASVPVYSAEKLSSAREDILRLVSASPLLTGEHGFSRFGTAALFDLVNSRRMMPCMNFRETFFPQAPSMNAYSFDRMFTPGKTGCSGCTVLCGRKTGDGRMLPEYNAMAHLSALVGNTSIRRVMDAASLCAETGMDPVSAASTIACYMEIKGLTPEDTDLLKLLKNTASSRDEGELLKQGASRFAAKTGRPELSMTVKGLELPAFDPRGAYGTALSYVTSTRGGCYIDACAISHEILRKPIATDRFTFRGKARMVKLSEDTHCAADSLALCGNVLYAASLEEYSKVFHAVTGTGKTAHDLILAGERINYNERIINCICGLTSADDDLPPRFFTEAGTSGDAMRISAIDREEFLNARAKYYRIRGLTQKGLPLKEKCQEYGLEWTDLN